MGRFEEVPYPVFKRVIDTNLFGCVHGAGAVLPYFRGQGEGILEPSDERTGIGWGLKRKAAFALGALAGGFAGLGYVFRRLYLRLS